MGIISDICRALVREVRNRTNNENVEGVGIVYPGGQTSRRSRSTRTRTSQISPSTRPSTRRSTRRNTGRPQRGNRRNSDGDSDDRSPLIQRQYRSRRITNTNQSEDATDETFDEGHNEHRGRSPPRQRRRRSRYISSSDDATDESSDRGYDKHRGLGRNRGRASRGRSCSPEWSPERSPDRYDRPHTSSGYMAGNRRYSRRFYEAEGTPFRPESLEPLYEGHGYSTLHSYDGHPVVNIAPGGRRW